MCRLESFAFETNNTRPISFYCVTGFAGGSHDFEHVTAMDVRSQLELISTDFGRFVYLTPSVLEFQVSVNAGVRLVGAGLSSLSHGRFRFRLQ